MGGRQGQSGIASRAMKVLSLRVIQGQLVDSEAGPGYKGVCGTVKVCVVTGQWEDEVIQGSVEGG